MRGGVKITGLKETEKYVNAQLQGIKVKTARGLIRASIIIHRETETVSPTVPVGDTGILRTSWHTSTFWSAGSYWIKMGFTANYAKWVHAMKDSNTKWSRLGSGGQWFQKAVERIIPRITTIIKGSIANK